jgi:hypothetical protein
MSSKVTLFTTDCLLRLAKQYETKTVCADFTSFLKDEVGDCSYTLEDFSYKDNVLTFFGLGDSYTMCAEVKIKNDDEEKKMFEFLWLCVDSTIIGIHDMIKNKSSVVEIPMEWKVYKEGWKEVKYSEYIKGKDPETIAFITLTEMVSSAERVENLLTEFEDEGVERKYALDEMRPVLFITGVTKSGERYFSDGLILDVPYSEVGTFLRSKLPEKHLALL